MSTVLEDAAKLATDQTLFGPLTAAIVRYAMEVIDEDPETEDHGQRLVLAYQVLHSPEQYVSRFAWAVSTNPTIVAKWGDDDFEGAFNDLQYVVNTIWSPVAGAGL